MQSNIFVKVGPLLKEKQFNIDVDSFIDHMAFYTSGKFVYPSAIHRELKLSIQDVYSIMELCAEQGLLEQYLQIYCPRCQRFVGSDNIYKTALEIPEIVNCVHCDEEINNPLQHAVVIYKVL